MCFSTVPCCPSTRAASNCRFHTRVAFRICHRGQSKDASGVYSCPLTFCPRGTRLCNTWQSLTLLKLTCAFLFFLVFLTQRDFCHREQLQQADIERWLGFITFLCEVFGTMRSSSGEPFRVLVCPIYTCLREVGTLIFSVQSSRPSGSRLRTCTSVHPSPSSFWAPSRLQTPHQGLVSGATSLNAISSRKSCEPRFSSHQLL